MYSVTARIQLGAVSPIVLTITPSFPICFPPFRSHSHCLHCLSVAGHVARCQLSSRVSYKSFFAIAGPVWPERPIRQLPFPRFRSRSAPPPENPQLLVSRTHIAGTERINRSLAHSRMLQQISKGAYRIWRLGGKCWRWDWPDSAQSDVTLPLIQILLSPLWFIRKRVSAGQGISLSTSISSRNVMLSSPKRVDHWERFNNTI